MTALFGPLHRGLRQRMCRSLCELGELGPAAPPARRNAVVAKLQDLLADIEAVVRAEQNVLPLVRSQVDSSFGSPDLLAGVQRLRLFMGEPAARMEMDAVYRYYALFVGEMLVQMHVKEVEVEPELRGSLAAASLALLREQLHEVAAPGPAQEVGFPA